MLEGFCGVLIALGIAVLGGFLLYSCLRQTAYNICVNYRHDSFLAQVRPYKRPVPCIPFCLVCGVLLFVLCLEGDPDGHGHWQHTAMILAFVWFLIALAWFDLKFMILPTTYIVVFFLVYIFGRLYDYVQMTWMMGILPDNFQGAIQFFGPYVTLKLIPIILVFVITQIYYRWSEKKQRHPGIGEGDRNLLLVLWLWFSPIEWGFVFVVAAILFLLANLFSAQKTSPQPFGPALSCSAILILLYATLGNS